MKDGGGPGVGPLAPIDPWVGEDVHVDIPGGDRRNRRRQGIAVAPSVHKAADCPDGEHQHDRFDYCHPEERKHRKAGGALEEQRPFPPSRTVKQKADAAFKEWYYAKRERDKDVDLDMLYGRYRQLKEIYGMARRWEASPEGTEWVNREKVKRAKGQGLKSREHYEEKAAVLQEKVKELDEEHKRLWKKYQVTPGSERFQYLGELRDNGEKIKAVRRGIARAKSMATLGFAREWTGIIQEIAGGVEPKISAIRTGSRSFAHYDMSNGIIGFSDRALEILDKVRNNPDLLWVKGPNLRPDRAAFAVSALVHEFLHSVNPAKGAYLKGGYSELLEEGLTEAIANRMVARADVLSKLLGTEVERGITAKPDHPAYVIYTNTVEYLAELAAQRSNSAPEWFLGKWKFHTDPKERGDAILIAAFGAQEFASVTWRGIIQEAKEKLPEMKEARQAQRVHKAPPYSHVVSQIMENLWGVPEFVYTKLHKVAGGAGSYEPYPPSTPAPTGGGGGSVEGGSRGGSLVPSNMDVRYTGSPPKGVRWQKFPRQGGESVGGAGAGAVEAMEKHNTPRSPHKEHDPRVGRGSKNKLGGRLLREFATGGGMQCSATRTAFGRCADVSRDFVEFLRERGIQANRVKAFGYKGPLERAYYRWQVSVARLTHKTRKEAGQRKHQSRSG